MKITHKAIVSLKPVSPKKEPFKTGDILISKVGQAKTVYMLGKAIERDGKTLHEYWQWQENGSTEYWVCPGWFSSADFKLFEGTVTLSN